MSREQCKDNMYHVEDGLNLILKKEHSVKRIHYCLSKTLSLGQLTHIFAVGRREYFEHELGIILETHLDDENYSDEDLIYSNDHDDEAGGRDNDECKYDEYRKCMYFGLKKLFTSSKVNQKILDNIYEKLLLLSGGKQNNNNNNNNDSNNNKDRKKSLKNAKNAKNTKNDKNDFYLNNEEVANNHGGSGGSGGSSNSSNSSIKIYGVEDPIFLGLVKTITTIEKEWQNIKFKESKFCFANTHVAPKQIKKMRIDFINDNDIVPTLPQVCQQCKDIKDFLRLPNSISELTIGVIGPFYGLLLFEYILNNMNLKNLCKLRFIYVKNARFASHRDHNAFYNVTHFYQHMTQWNSFVSKFRSDCLISGIKLSWMMCNDDDDDNNNNNDNDDDVFEHIFDLLYDWYVKENIGCDLWFKSTCNFNINDPHCNLNCNLRWLDLIFSIINRLFKCKLRINSSKMFPLKTNNIIFAVNEKIRFKIWYNFGSTNKKFKLVLHVSLK